jgi:hypothetical protein
VVGKNALAPWWNVQLLGALFEMYLRGNPVSALDVDGGVVGQVDDEVALPELVNLLLNGHHFEGAQLLGVLELLHVEGPEAGVVESPRHDPKGVTHEDLVYPVTRHQIRGGQLHVVSGVRRGNGEDVIFDIRQEVVCIKQRKRERVKPEKPKERVLGCHGNVKEEMPVLSVIQQRGLDLKEVGVVLHQKFTSGLQGSLLQFTEELDHFSWIQIIDCEPLVNRRLDSMGDPAQFILKLVFNPAQAGVQQGGVGQNQGEQQAANLVEAVLYAHEVLGKVLNHLK